MTRATSFHEMSFKLKIWTPCIYFELNENDESKIYQHFVRNEEILKYYRHGNNAVEY